MYEVIEIAPSRTRRYGQDRCPIATKLTREQALRCAARLNGSDEAARPATYQQRPPALYQARRVR